MEIHMLPVSINQIMNKVLLPISFCKGFEDSRIQVFFFDLISASTIIFCYIMKTKLIE